MALVLDTGPLFAALDADDVSHASCASLLRNTKERKVVPAPVLPELYYFCNARLGADAFLEVLAEVERGGIEIAELRLSDYRRVAELCDRYRDLRVGFVDAAVLAVVERLGKRKLATLDHRHFSVMRPAHVEALELLP